MKKTSLFLVLTCALLMFTGCSKKGEDTTTASVENSKEKDFKIKKLS